ncbi:hypothetical protein CVT24_003724 [Panaeolus cyanescens]|uniref:Uncharacterized protein n=1 Tax=Panaeolus cyanescens TaxID=181874 RepID=A0A409YXL5_9AGAR|nr:hypothetical protein CVT24_003724 [Panaeolus cyanescens]
MTVSSYTDNLPLNAPVGHTTLFVIRDDSTITVDHIRERPLKRKRSLEDTKAVDGDRPAEFLTPLPENPKKGIQVQMDKTYWSTDPDAECVIRVQNILFNVNYFFTLLMSRQLTSSMLDLERHISMHGPTTIHSPMVISCTPSQFRAFLWVNYTKIIELHKPIHEFEPDNMLTFMSNLLMVTSFVRSFKTPTIQDWVTEALAEVANNRVFLASCDAQIISLLLKHFSASKETQHAKKALVFNWIERLKANDDSLVSAIMAADQYDLPNLRGAAYFFYLSRKDVCSKTNPKGYGYTCVRSLNTGSGNELPTRHASRLMQGHFSLSLLSHQLRNNPIRLEMGGGCSDPAHAQCSAIWEERWRAATNHTLISNLAPHDVVNLGVYVFDYLRDDKELQLRLPFGCRVKGLKDLERLRDELGDWSRLAEHFTE